ncbi:MAG: UDP-N-acetylmuramate--L-alanine ligase [Verrucomicrobiota bacterium]
MSDVLRQLQKGETSLRVHLIGVAGSGMSGLAWLLLGQGHRVSGSDKVSSDETERLVAAGLAFQCPHSAEAVADAEVVIHSSAIRPTNVALAAAQKRGCLLLRRAEALTTLMHSRRNVVISGTHGKTTTSSLTTHLFRTAGLTPSHYIGAEIPLLGRNAHWAPESEWFIAEADESDGTLIHYQPHHQVVLNLEAEHLDFYPDLEAIREVFLVPLQKATGSVIYCRADEGAEALCRDLPQAVPYGWDEQCEYFARGVKRKDSRMQFEIVERGESLGKFTLGISGRHNVLNALAAVAVARAAGATADRIRDGLETFRGARRRFETLFRSPDYQVVDDYGHHPSEIAATLEAARGLQPKRIAVLFQPHRYSRTQKLAQDFGPALALAEVVALAPIYPANELPIEGVTSQLIAEEVARVGHQGVESFSDPAEACAALANRLQPGDLVLSLGAGNIHLFGKALARDIETLSFLRHLLGDGGEARLYEPMRKHTTLRVGGPAQFWVEPVTEKEMTRVVAFCRKMDLPLTVVGRGSNLVVRDGGIRGVVLHPMKGEFAEVHVYGNEIVAGVGARLKKIASVAQKAGLTGFEWMEGIPGNLGGALRMNAGAMGVETFDQAVSVRVIDESNEVVEMQGPELGAAYRNVESLRRRYALSARLVGHPGKSEAIASLLQASKEKRLSSQPLAASAGCTFKNPESIPAGQLVEELGLKGRAIGPAEVSEVHGNFIVNRGGASASEVLRLMEEIQEIARQERGLDLHPEVQILGEETIFDS